VEEQKKIPPRPVIIEGEEEFKVEKILNKRVVRGKKKFLVQWKEYTVEEDTWKKRENLENTKELVEEFERDYREETKEIKRQEKEDNQKVFSRGLPGRFTAKILWEWSNKEYDRQRERRWEKNWNWWKHSLGQGNLKKGPYYKIVPRKETISHAFLNLIDNI